VVVAGLAVSNLCDKARRVDGTFKQQSLRDLTMAQGFLHFLVKASWVR
jgi:hypothetical protein